jgi:TPR repeat protein
MGQESCRGAWYDGADPLTRLVVLTILGLPKAEYACGYFKEMGIGCRRDTLGANAWYVKAADSGDERAKQRLAIIQAAASGQAGVSTTTDKGKLKKEKGDKDKDGKEKDENCVVM